MGFVIFIHMSLLDTYEEIIEAADQELPITGEWLIGLGFTPYTYSADMEHPTYSFSGNICGNYFTIQVRNKQTHPFLWEVTFITKYDRIDHYMETRSNLLRIYGKELKRL